MTEQEKVELEMEVKKEDNQYAPSLTTRVIDFVSVLIATLMFVATILSNIFANFPQFGAVQNGTGEVSDFYSAQITPSGSTFSIWGVIYVLQCLWLIYGWSLVFRPKVPRSIHFFTYLFYTLANLGNFIWIFVWGNFYAQAAFPIIAVCVISLYAAITAQAIHLYRQSPALSSTKAFKVDLWISRILVLNALAFYATWVSAATQLNFIILLQYFGNVSATDASTIGLSILLVEILVYFVLENTVLDRFLRFIGLVYFGLIWALSGSVANQWAVEPTDRRNPIFTVCLLVLAIVLFLVRIVLWIVFYFKRPLPMPGKKEKDDLVV